MTTTFELAAAHDERAARKGIAIMLFGIFVFAFMNAIVKDLTQTYPVRQVVFFRGFFGLVPMMILLTVFRVRPTLTFRRALSHVPHCLSMVTTLLLAYVSFAMLPLAEVTAIFFLQPVIVALMSAVFLRERIPLRLWMAVTGGFLGVLLIARPTGISTDLGLFCGIAAAVTGAAAMLQQRELSRQNDSLEIVFWFMVLSAIVVAPSVPFAWVSPTPGGWGLLALMGIVSGFGQVLIILPLRYAPASRLAPMYYTNLLGGLAFGYFWFGEVPDLVMLAGCGVVIASTALVLGAKSVPPPAPAAVDCRSDADRSET